MKKILCICPSIYPKKLITMMDSFLTTRSDNTNIRVNYEIGNITKIINRTFMENDNYDFYHVTNDDCIYKTPEWDLKLAKKGKITYGNDGIPEGINGQFLMIDGDIARAVGWLQMPMLNRYCGDVCWRFIGEQLGILEHIPEVIINHNWEGADANINQEDMAEFSRWLPFAFKDMEHLLIFREV